MDRDNGRDNLSITNQSFRYHILAKGATITPDVLKYQHLTL